MLEKILDRYYIKKVVKEIIKMLRMYFISFRFVYEKDVIRIFIKKHYYDDTMYELIGSLDKKRGFVYLSNIKRVNKELQKEIDKYFKEHK